MSRSTDIFQRFCSASGASIWRKPFSYKLGASPWSVASNGYWFVAVPGKSPFQGLADDPPEVVQTFLKIFPKDPLVASVAKVLAWTGPSGRDKPISPFPDALDRDSFSDKEIDGVIKGVPFDRRRLAYLLEQIDIPQVTLWNASAAFPNYSVLGVMANHWRMALFGVDSDPDDSTLELPKFPPPSDEEDLFDLAMALDGGT